MSDYNATRLYLSRLLYQDRHSLSREHLQDHWKTYGKLWLEVFAHSSYPPEECPTNEDEFIDLWLKADAVLNQRPKRARNIIQSLFP